MGRGLVNFTGATTTVNLSLVGFDGSAISGSVTIPPNGHIVKIVAAISPQLFAAQEDRYRNEVLPERDWIDSTVISNRGRRLMHDWLMTKVADEYAMTSDWDNRWRTGENMDEVIEEAHLSPRWLLEGIERFVRDRDKRLRRIQSMLDAARE
jgi:transketolase